jgi:hypothetical protein
MLKTKIINKARLQLEGVNLLQKHFYALLTHSWIEDAKWTAYGIGTVAEAFTTYKKSKKIEDALILYKYIESAKRFLNFVIEQNGENIDAYKCPKVEFNEVVLKLGYFYDLEKTFPYYIWHCSCDADDLIEPKISISNADASVLYDIDSKKLSDLKSNVYTNYADFLTNTKTVLTKLFPQPMIAAIKIHDIKFVKEKNNAYDSSWDERYYNMAVITDQNGTQITLADYKVMTHDYGKRNNNGSRSVFYDIVTEDLIGTDIVVQMYYMDGKIFGNPLAVITDENFITFKF